MTEILDCLIVGGGPAGLTAATYLGRFRRKARLFDVGESRCSLIPLSHNLPGWPEGINGIELLNRMREQAALYGVEVEPVKVERLSRREDGIFAAEAAGETLLSRKVILATGGSDIRPSLPNVDYAIRQGLIRLCPICDAYELIDRKVAIFGFGPHGLREALFLRDYTEHVSLLTQGLEHGLSQPERDQLAAAGIELICEPLSLVELDQDAGVVSCLLSSTGQEWRFDSLYSALGTRVRSELAIELGAGHTEKGCLITDGHQLTDVDGLYAIGDVVQGLNQIAVACGQAASAATHIHNCLRGMSHV